MHRISHTTSKLTWIAVIYSSFDLKSVNVPASWGEEEKFVLFFLNKMILKDENAVNKHYLPLLRANCFVKESFCLMLLPPPYVSVVLNQ